MKLGGVGIGISLLCAVHCALMPLLAGASGWLAADVMAAPWLETGAILGAALAGYVSLGWSYYQHRRPQPLLLLTLGLLVMIAGHALLPHEQSVYASAGGAAILIAAQLLNRGCPAPCCGECDPSGEAAEPVPVRSGSAG